MKEYEEQLIRGLSPEEARRLIGVVNGITKIFNVETAQSRANKDQPPLKYFGQA